MGSIKASLFISLDGVIESPENWHFPYFNDEMGAVVGAQMSAADATLLGRNTYEAFAGYWPSADPADRACAVVGDLLCRNGSHGEARDQFLRAAALTKNSQERTVMQDRAARCAAGHPG